MLGDFLEISLSCRDILASLEFYRKLGFVEAPAREAWKHPYAVVTDGRLYIGLHAREAAPPALSFALPELRGHLSALEALGIEFDYCNIELHRFNEVGFPHPDGGLVALLEARTYSPVHSEVQTLCGYFLEYRLPVQDEDATLKFWDALGLMADKDETGQARVSWGGINIVLEPRNARSRPALVFANSDLDVAASLCEMRGLTMQNDTRGVHLTTPEGLTLTLQPED
jgi:catechol 2,3-dioxygenase-like lactoylglutathione lyase family enzyme